MSYLRTADCPPFPDTWRGRRAELPVSHMTDEEIDHAIELILRKGATIHDIPTSQYGRRVAVQTFMKLEEGAPFREEDVQYWGFTPGQPR